LHEKQRHIISAIIPNSLGNQLRGIQILLVPILFRNVGQIGSVILLPTGYVGGRPTGS
jgi:hypothetical protein